jgi:oligosaccharide repeat unit polymerase
MMDMGLLIVVITCIAVLNYRLARSVLYPPFIFCSMWMFVLCVYQLDLIQVDALHLQTLVLLGLGAFVFSVGGSIGYLIPDQLLETRVTLIALRRNESRGSVTVKWALALGCFVGMLLIIRHTFSAGAGIDGGSILARARAAGVEAQNSGEGGISLLAYVPAVSIYVATLFMVERRDKLFLFVTCTAFITAVFTTGRGPILMLFSSLTAVYLLQEGKLGVKAALRFVRVPIIVFAGLYILLTFTNKDTSGVSGGVAGVIVYFVVGYIVGPTAALDYVLQNPLQYAHEPQHTFKLLLNLAAHAHLLNYSPPPFLDSFIDVPFPTNVYTGYKFFYTDFGFIGCLFIVGIIGVFHALLYRKATTGSKFGLYLFAYSVFPVLMFVFDDRYSAIGENINAFTLGALYFATQGLVLFPEGTKIKYRSLLRMH